VLGGASRANGWRECLDSANERLGDSFGRLEGALDGSRVLMNAWKERLNGWRVPMNAWKAHANAWMVQLDAWKAHSDDKLAHLDAWKALWTAGGSV
jgi:hypothetical protein